MKPSASISFAGRVGQAVGRLWRGYVRQERKVNDWLVGLGIPAGGATVLLWSIKLVVLGALLYSALWLVFLLVILLMTCLVFSRGQPQKDIWVPREEMRNGEAGFGLYSSSGQRLDPHDPNAPYDD
ncbi:DUF3742 family protein [Pseudomonas citronellolis]|uniref:DUF3742 family protein n=1 Tax=Pseudomonas citronellolis TaxID=53408 RepID=UPI0021C003BA|nr:DUF3742 family protein [Pseudomonas citronellolis]UXJ50152.1 DUF3742 family protein [Pseudomonas citronellolis]